MINYDDLMVDHDEVQSDRRLLVNGVLVDDAHEDLLLEWLWSTFEGATSCPFCHCSFRQVDYDDGEEEYAMVRVCINCGHWQCCFSSEEGRTWDGERMPYHARLSKLRSFEAVLPECCADEIVQHLRRKPELFHQLSPSTLERLVAAVFKANYAASEVIHVGKPSDGGVDVLFINSGKTQWLIQVKTRQGHGVAEGVEVLRNLLGTMVLQGARNGVLVSTADHFTYRAMEAVRRANEVGYTIELIDKGILNRMIAPLLPDRPWMSFFHEYPHLIEWFDIHLPSRRQLRLFD